MTDRFVASGGSGKIATSDDGFAWTQQTTGLSGTIRALAYGTDRMWLAATGTQLSWSNDGITWHAVGNPAWGNVNAIVYSPFWDCWVAVTDSGGIWKSANGISGWASQTTGLPGSATLQDIVWDDYNLLFWAVGTDLTTPKSGAILYSFDGESWSRSTGPASGFKDLRAVGCGSGTVVISDQPASSTTTKLAYSADAGSSWTPTTTPFTGTTSAAAIGFGASGFIAVGSSGILATSSDGTSWTQQTTSFGSTSIADVVYADIGLWVAVAGSGKLETSADDGVTWDVQTSSFGTTFIADVTYGTVTAFEPAYAFTADAVIRRTPSASFSADAEVVEFSIRIPFNAVIYKNQARSATLDALVVFDISGTNEGRNPHDRAEQHFGTFYATQVAYSETSSLETWLRYLWNRVATLEAGGYVRSSLTANATFLKRISRSWAIDAFMARKFTADALLRILRTASSTADAVLQGTRAGSFAADSYVLSGTEFSFTADSFFQRLVASSFTADGVLFATVSGSFTANAVIMPTFTANAVLLKALSGSFTADATIGSTGESGLLGDHILGQHELGGE